MAKALFKWRVFYADGGYAGMVEASSEKTALKKARYEYGSPRERGMTVRKAWQTNSANPSKRKKARSSAKKLAAWVRGQIKTNPRVRTRVVRKNSTTIKGYKSVTVKKLPDGRVQVTGRK